MTTPRNNDLRIVSATAAATETDAERTRTTLRIDAARPVPAPQPSPEESRDQQLAAAERELDRLHHAANTEQLVLGQHMNWLLASQAIFMHAFLMVFVVGSMGVIPMNHWMLGGLALLGILCALALHSSLDRGRQTLALLIVQRRAAEIELTALSGRAPNLPKNVSRIGSWIGPAFVFGWLLLLACTAGASI